MTVDDTLRVAIRQDYEQLEIPANQESVQDINFLVHQILRYHATELEHHQAPVHEWYQDFKKSMLKQIFYDIAYGASKSTTPDLCTTFCIGIDGHIDWQGEVLAVNVRQSGNSCRIAPVIDQPLQPNLWEKIFSRAEMSENVTKRMQDKFGLAPQRVIQVAAMYLQIEYNKLGFESRFYDREVKVGTHRIYLNGMHYLATSYPYNDSEFWKTVAQERPYAIVKLSGGFSYWPELGKSKKVTENLTVTTLDQQTISSSLIQRTIEVANDHIVFQYDFTKWPDFSAPQFNELLALLKQIPDDTKPLLVHCGGGIGRTGTFIAAHSGYREWRMRNARPSFYHIVREERRQRPNQMVENDSQYLFLHQFFNKVVDSEKFIA